MFVFNNDGYLSIRSTQKNFFGGHLVGESAASGVSFPDMLKLAEAYGIPAVRIERHAELAEAIRAVLDTPGPVLCDVRMYPDAGVCAARDIAAAARRPDGFQAAGRHVSFPGAGGIPSNMIIPPWEPTADNCLLCPASDRRPTSKELMNPD